jgi:hypothetical protein
MTRLRVFLKQALVNKRLEDIARQVKAALDQILIAFEDAVFVLDADNAIIARGSCRSLAWTWKILLENSCITRS